MSAMHVSSMLPLPLRGRMTDEDVEPAKALDRALDHVLGVGLLADVALDGPCLSLGPLVGDDAGRLLNGDTETRR